MQTPETMIMAGTAIKIVIDLLPISGQYKRPTAILLGLLRSFAFIHEAYDLVIFYGITTGASAIGINELSKKSLSSSTDNETNPMTTDIQMESMK